MPTEDSGIWKAGTVHLNPESKVTIDRPSGTVSVDDQPVTRFGAWTNLSPQEQNQLENYADTLWTEVEDLKAARAGWPV